MNTRIPPGLIRCDICGGFNGTTFEKHLARAPSGPDGSEAIYEPDRRVSALCRCHGPLCRGCGVNRIYRPTSNYYHEGLNRILHVPWFMGTRLCDSCDSRCRLESLHATQASLTERDKAVHVPCERRPGNSSPHGIHVLILKPGRLASINAMMVMPTYASLLSGIPDPDSDAELILRARKRAGMLWGIRPTHVIAPIYEYASAAGRAHLRMPPVEYHVWLESDAIPGSDKTRSQLVVIWFGNIGYDGDLLESIEDRLRTLPWETLAGGCDP